jgi:hypothetical protein
VKSSNRRVVKLRAESVIELHPQAGSQYSTTYLDDEYRQVCAETVKAISESLMDPSYQPERIGVIEIMQEVGQGSGSKVEYSRGRIVVTRAGVAHQLAESNLKRRLDDEQDWLMVTKMHLSLPCGTRHLRMAETYQH